ncbi:hypothetical protein GCM10008101_06880 [Lysobacter xinjiangensis]|uniref:Phage abortive infection protein n=1 Tax=Cognatilysobacter xinjiangensis TaxID=546892 RepID=A0ABQ3BSC7_9GAMM|nr:hypothetical protein [Lysobacter xinjiangensis]GGZ56091.1 hypothetical protein GCM10008101_06880 [Lysobacter xinjiangensis]
MSDDQKDIDDSVTRALFIAGSSYVVAVIALVAYVIRFGKREWGDVDQWGLFGDFLGGVVNPAVGIATALLVVFTLKVTRTEAHRTRQQLDDQLNLLRKQHRLGEMLKRLDGAMDEWRRLMERPVRRLVIYNGSQLTEVSTWQTLGDAIDSEQFRNQIWATVAVPAEAGKARAAWEPIVNDARHLLHEIAAYCNAYEVEAGNRTVADYYRRRLAYGVLTIDAMGLLPVTVRNAMDFEELEVRSLQRS